jgi:transketolase
VDGHDIKALKETMARIPINPHKPTTIICHTVKGKGIIFAENNLTWHHKSRVSDEELWAMHKALGGIDAPEVS